MPKFGEEIQAAEGKLHDIVVAVEKDAAEILDWVGLTQQNTIGLMKTTITQLDGIYEKEIKPQAKIIFPQIESAYLLGGFAAAKAATVLAVLPLLKTAGIELFDDIRDTLSNIVVTRVRENIENAVHTDDAPAPQAAVNITASAQVEVPIPSEAAAAAAS